MPKGRRPSLPRCLDCMNLRTVRGVFWCRFGYDQDYAYGGLAGKYEQLERPPQPQKVEWLETPDGGRWARLLASTCEQFERDEVSGEAAQAPSE